MALGWERAKRAVRGPARIERFLVQHSAANELRSADAPVLGLTAGGWSMSNTRNDFDSRWTRKSDVGSVEQQDRPLLLGAVLRAPAAEVLQQGAGAVL